MLTGCVSSGGIELENSDAGRTSSIWFRFNHYDDEEDDDGDDGDDDDIDDNAIDNEKPTQAEIEHCEQRIRDGEEQLRQAEEALR